MPKNSLKGKDVRGLAVESGMTVFVGQCYPGYSSPYIHGKTFVGYKKPSGVKGSVYWAWPLRDRDKITRGVKTVKMYTELPDIDPQKANQKGAVKTEDKKDTSLGSIPWLRCSPYWKKFPSGDDGREVNLGPMLKKGAAKKGDRESVFEKETYYAVIS